MLVLHHFIVIVRQKPKDDISAKKAATLHGPCQYKDANVAHQIFLCNIILWNVAKESKEKASRLFKSKFT